MPQPLARLDVALPADAFGTLTYCGTDFNWPFDRDSFYQSISSSGLAPDPTGLYLIQAPVDVWQNGAETVWTAGAGDAYTYTHGTYPATAGARAGKTFLRAIPPTASPGAAFSRTVTLAHDDDEGFKVEIYRGQAAPSASPSLYVHLNSPAGALPAGWTGYRVALVPGSPIRLQTSSDNVAWTDAAVSALDCEGYLDSTERSLVIDVLPESDVTWDPDLSDGDPPPNQLVVTLGAGDAVLSVPGDWFPGGFVNVSGAAGQWAASYALRRFTVLGSAATASQTRERPFQSVPSGDFDGYAPDLTAVTVTPTVTGPASCQVALAVSGAALVDATGYATDTVFLVSAEASFPPVWTPPSAYPRWASYYPVYVRHLSWWDQVQGTVRSAAWCEFVDDSFFQFIPGGATLPAARAARLWLGYESGPGNPPRNPADPTGQGLWPQMTGLTGLAESGGYTWEWRGNRKYYGCSLEDRLRPGDGMAAVGYLPPFDRQCHYYAQRQLAYRLGVNDAWLNFPYVGRDQDSPYYYLAGGTPAAPVWQFPPSLGVCPAMQQVRQRSAEFTPGSALPLPMVLATDPLGNLDYFPLATGVVNAFQRPNQTLWEVGLTSAQDFNGAGTEDAGVPNLDGFYRGTLKVTANLNNIRTPVVFEGLDVASGGAAFAVAYNEALGGGPLSDPNAYGYLGFDAPLYDINRLYTTPTVAQVAADLAAIEMAFPGVREDHAGWMQPTLFPLSPYTVTDYPTLGTPGAVPFYATWVLKEVDLRDPLAHRADSRVSGRLLGQAG